MSYYSSDSVHDYNYDLPDSDEIKSWSPWPHARTDRFERPHTPHEIDLWSPIHPSPHFGAPALESESSQSMEVPIPRRGSSGHTDDFHHRQPDTHASDAFEAEYVAGSSSFVREWATRHGVFSTQSVELPLENPPSPRTSSRKTWESAGPSTESFAALYRHYVSGEGFAHPKSGLRSGQWSQSVEVRFPARQLEPVSGTSGFQPWDTEHSSEGRADVETAAPADSARPGNSKTDGALPTSASSPPPDDWAAPSGAPLLTTRRGVKEWLRRYNVRSSDAKTESANASPRTPVLFTTYRYGGDFPGIALVDAEEGRVQGLRGFDQLVPLVGSVEDRMEFERNVLLVIKWPGYPPWVSLMPATNHFSSSKDGSDKEGPFHALTLGEIAQNVAKLTRSFIQHTESKEVKKGLLEDPQHEQSPPTGGIMFEHWVLCALERTQSSWQAHFRTI